MCSFLSVFFCEKFPKFLMSFDKGAAPLSRVIGRPNVIVLKNERMSLVKCRNVVNLELFIFTKFPNGKARRALLETCSCK